MGGSRLALSSTIVCCLIFSCFPKVPSSSSNENFLAPQTTFVNGNSSDHQWSRLFHQYRFIAISLGGSNLRVSINDGQNHVLHRALVKWDRIYGRGGVKTALPDEIIQEIAVTIEKLINESGVSKKTLHRVVCNLAGPVDEKKGIFGSDFKTPNLPFNLYPFVERLQKALAEKGIIAEVTIINDAKGALWGETYHPDGLLRNCPDGGIVIIGTGVNIAVKKNGEVYFGPTGREILEAGHNLVQERRDKKGRIHFVWTGGQAKGGHPVERGRVPPAVKRQGKRASGAFLQDQANWIQKNPNYPVIAWDDGMRDFEDTISGPRVNRRLRQAELKGYTVNNLTKKAQNGDPVAIHWIQQIGAEIGYALAAFMAVYSQEPFVEHLVLVSGVSENLGKGVVRKGHKEDIFMESIRSGILRELVRWFKIPSARARVLAEGVMRSKLTYERELVSYQPTDEDVLVDANTTQPTTVELFTSQSL